MPNHEYCTCSEANSARRQHQAESRLQRAAHRESPRRCRRWWRAGSSARRSIPRHQRLVHAAIVRPQGGEAACCIHSAPPLSAYRPTAHSTITARSRSSSGRDPETLERLRAGRGAPGIPRPPAPAPRSPTRLAAERARGRQAGRRRTAVVAAAAGSPASARERDQERQRHQARGQPKRLRIHGTSKHHTHQPARHGGDPAEQGKRRSGEHRPAAAKRTAGGESPRNMNTASISNAAQAPTGTTRLSDPIERNPLRIERRRPARRRTAPPAPPTPPSPCQRSSSPRERGDRSQQQHGAATRLNGVARAVRRARSRPEAWLAA